jgi:hypothetical protein
MFPRFLFTPSVIDATVTSRSDVEEAGTCAAKESAKVSAEGGMNLPVTSHTSEGQSLIDQFPKRTYLQVLRPWTHYPQNKTGFWQYFRRPFFLWGFPNIVIVGCSPQIPFDSHVYVKRKGN